MSDIKDILGVARGGPPAEKQEKPKEQKMVKPKGMSREAFALLSSTHPLVPSQLMGELKKPEAKERAKKRGQVAYQWRAFDNPARADGLRLEHWVKCYRDAATGAVAPAEKDYPFVKYNKHVPVLRYDDDEWAHLVAHDPAWSRADTDHLLDLAERLDQRWLVIADRWPPPGGRPCSVEELKARYYSVARQLLVGREGGTESVSNHPLVRHPYSLQHERERKRGLELLLARTPEQDAEEDVILAEAARIEAKRRVQAGAKRAPAAAAAPSVPPPPPVVITEYEEEPPAGTPPLFDATGTPALPAAPADGGVAPRVLARSALTREMADAAMGRSLLAPEAPSLLQKSLQASMAELKLLEVPRAATRAVCGAYLALLHEVGAHMELKRRLAARQALAGSKRVKREDSGGAGEDGEPRSEKRQRVAKKAFEG